MLPALLAPLVSAHLRLSQVALSATPAPSPTGTPGTTGAPGITATLGPTPSPSETDPVTKVITNVVDRVQDTSAKACLPDDLSVCGVVVRITGNKGLGQVLEVVLGTPLRLILIIGFGILIRRVLHRLIDRLSERIATGAANATPPRNAPTGTGTGGTEDTSTSSTGGPGNPGRAGSSGGTGSNPGGTNGNTGGSGSGPDDDPDNGARPPGTGTPAPSPLLTTRRQARSRTLAQVLRSITTIAITLIVVLMVLQELGFSVAPLLSIAGVFGVALGFGAQSLVRDVVSGMFMIVEDQYGVGDVVDVGAASGSVEAVGLRITRLRDVNGTVWYVRNGEILRVGNQSQGWSRAVLDVNVGYAEDLDHVEEVLLETARELGTDEKFASFVMDEPEVWGVEALTVDGVVMRVVVKTQPLQQWGVARELRRRIKQRFDAENIEMRTMPRTVVVNEDDDPGPHPREDEALGH